MMANFFNFLWWFFGKKSTVLLMVILSLIFILFNFIRVLQPIILFNTHFQLSLLFILFGIIALSLLIRLK